MLPSHVQLLFIFAHICKCFVYILDPCCTLCLHSWLICVNVKWEMVETPQVDWSYFYHGTHLHFECLYDGKYSSLLFYTIHCCTLMSRCLLSASVNHINPERKSSTICDGEVSVTSFSLVLTLVWRFLWLFLLPSLSIPWLTSANLLLIYILDQTHLDTLILMISHTH